MSTTSKNLISPFRGILICLNTMIAAGLFINPKPLTLMAGEFGFLGYVIGAIILLPLILSIAELTRLHPVAGGLYVYSKMHLGPWAGFVAAWSYFVGKTAAMSLLLHKFVCFFSPHVPLINAIPPLILDMVLVFSFAFLNVNGVSIGGSVQYVTILLKVIPLLASFFIGALYFDLQNFGGTLSTINVLGTIPIAVFALMGFEVICSIANMVEDSEKNTAKVILTAFYIVTAVNILFHLCVYGVIGMQLSVIQYPIMALANTFFSHPLAGMLLNGAVFASILGGFYSILTSNCWNLATISNGGHLPFKKYLCYTNAKGIPVFSILVEASLACAILFVTADQIPLQNMAVLAQILCHSLSAGAAVMAVATAQTKRLWIGTPMLAVGSCCLIMGIAMHRIIVSGVSVPFLVIYATGFIFALSQYFKKFNASF